MVEVWRFAWQQSSEAVLRPVRQLSCALPRLRCSVPKILPEAEKLRVSLNIEIQRLSDEPETHLMIPMQRLPLRLALVSVLFSVWSSSALAQQPASPRFSREDIAFFEEKVRPL